MSGDVSNSMALPFLQPSNNYHHQQYPSAAAFSYLGGGELPVVSEAGSQHQAKFYGDTQRQLILRQAPMHARVAMGKEKGQCKA